MDRPPGTPPLSFVGPTIAQLFETAFSQAAVKGGRPTARDWAAALQKLKANTKQCAAYKGHWHPSHLSSCPWCEMEAHGANPLFPFVAPAAPGTGPTLDVEGLWRQIQGLSALGPAPAIPMPAASPSQAARAAGPPNNMANPIAVAVALAVFGGGCLVAPALFWIFAIAAIAAYNITLKQLSNVDHIERFRKILSDAEAQCAQATSDWQRRAGDEVFCEAKTKFESVRTALNQIPIKRIQALDQLKKDQRRLQLNCFLDRFDLEDAKIKGIGPGRKRTLESYGIETAEDVVPHRVNAVPGFGPKMLERLMKWRRSLEAKFVFNPAKAIDPRDIAKVERDTLALRGKTEIAAKAAYTEVLQAHAHVLAIRKEMQSQMGALQAAVAQARADYEFVRG